LTATCIIDEDAALAQAVRFTLKVRTLLLFTAISMLFALGCGAEATDPAPADDPAKEDPVKEDPVDEPTIIDDLPDEPELPADAIRFEFPEQIIPGATEVQKCIYLEPIKEDMYLTALESFQGKYGHHFVVFKTSNELFNKEPGTVIDCTNGKTMFEITPAISSVNFGLEKFPEGIAVKLPAGTQMVLQQHYVNTQLKSIRVKDVMHLRTVDPASVEQLAGSWGTSDILFELKPKDEVEGDQVVDFECEVPHDMELLVAGPHMHEWGTEIYVWAGPKDDPQLLIDIPKWMPEYRDEPPVQDYTAAPHKLVKGDVIRTKCVFQNTTDETLTFPGEMCASYGYFISDVKSDEWTCAGVTH